MHLNKIEIGFGIDQFHTLVLIFFTIVVMDLPQLGCGYSVHDQGSLTAQLLVQLVCLVLRSFGYAKLQEDIFHLVAPCRVFFQI